LRPRAATVAACFIPLVLRLFVLELVPSGPGGFRPRTLPGSARTVSRLLLIGESDGAGATTPARSGPSLPCDWPSWYSVLAPRQWSEVPHDRECRCNP